MTASIDDMFNSFRTDALEPVGDRDARRFPIVAAHGIWPGMRLAR
jgi:hypothetical protein